MFFKLLCTKLCTVSGLDLLAISPTKWENLRKTDRTSLYRLENVSLNHGEGVLDCQNPFSPIPQHIIRDSKFHPALCGVLIASFQ